MTTSASIETTKSALGDLGKYSFDGVAEVLGLCQVEGESYSCVELCKKVDEFRTEVSVLSRFVKSLKKKTLMGEVTLKVASGLLRTAEAVNNKKEVVAEEKVKEPEITIKESTGETKGIMDVVLEEIGKREKLSKELKGLSESSDPCTVLKVMNSCLTRLVIESDKRRDYTILRTIADRYLSVVRELMIDSKVDQGVLFCKAVFVNGTSAGV